MGSWKLANRDEMPGMLDSVRRFTGTGGLRCTIVSVPTEMNVKKALENIGGLASPYTRSFEVWWDSIQQRLDIVLAATAHDLDKFKQAIYNMYPNVAFDDIPHTVPEWFDATGEYQAFDVGYRHGHFFTVFETRNSHILMTQVANTIQLARHAWIQFVFRNQSFVRYLQEHSANLKDHYRTVTSSSHFTVSDLLFSGRSEGRDHPEKYRDFAVNFRLLDAHTMQKTQSAHIMLSVRGLIESSTSIDLDFSEIESLPMESVRSGFEHLTKHAYPYARFSREAEIRVNSKKTAGSGAAIFSERLLPEAAPLKALVSKYAKRSWTGRYRQRRSPPFLLMTPQELGLLVHLPDPKTRNLTITRRQAIPQQQMSKSGFCLGYQSRLYSIGYKPDGFFGIVSQASEAQGIVLSADDIPTHVYVVGGTKSGKTTLIRCVAKHMEMANMRGTFPNAFIMIDPKGSDSYDFLRQCESESCSRGRVRFLDPIETKFSMNILELPEYPAEKRQVVVSQYVGYIMQMIEYWYQGSESFVRLKRILDTLLQYVYLHSDKPTFLDLYEIIIMMQQDGRSTLTKMFKELGKPEAALQQAIESVAGMEKKAYEPALNRLEKFATDPILRHMFCVRKSTIRFDDLVSEGAYTVIRLSPLNIPQHIITLAKQTLVIKLWYTIQERAEGGGGATQVLLALDEFQDVAGLPIIESMLTQARSYGLGLLLSHQTTTQLDDRLFEIITGNAGTQFVGRVSGRDGGRFGDAWDPSYSREIKSQLATQEYHHWTARLVAEEGKAQPMPVQFWPVLTPVDARDTGFIDSFVEEQRSMYGTGAVDASLLQGASRAGNAWLTSVPREPPPRDEWYALLSLDRQESPMSLKQVTAGFMDGTVHRDAVSRVLASMVKNGMISKGTGYKGRYSIPAETATTFLTFDPGMIGSASDIPVVMVRAVQYYTSRGNFLTMAIQDHRKDRRYTDLAAYDYREEIPISIEIESDAEVKTHPEHVKLNMVKWREMGFSECHVWSTNPEIGRIRETLPSSEKDKVRIFIVGGDSGAPLEQTGHEEDGDGPLWITAAESKKPPRPKHT